MSKLDATMTTDEDYRPLCPRCITEGKEIYMGKHGTAFRKKKGKVQKYHCSRCGHILTGRPVKDGATEPDDGPDDVDPESGLTAEQILERRATGIG